MSSVNISQKAEKCCTNKMQKQKENLFVEKFSLLYSQENTEEINWSSSSTSDYEDTSLQNRSCNQVIKKRSMKRKRKKKVSKNISNLNITKLDTSRESKKEIYADGSPILGCNTRQKSLSLSPILKPLKSFQRVNKVSSPILTSKTIPVKSPILVPRTESPKNAVKARKKLFNHQNTNNANQSNLKLEDSIDTPDLNKADDEATIKSQIISRQSINIEEFDENNSINTKTSKAKLELVKRVKSFFDSHFNSENTSVTSQNSISDIITPKNSTKTSDEIEIFTCKTQGAFNNNSNSSFKQETSANSSESSVYNFSKTSKKIKYKKDGLAYRLNSLLKKQNASVALWQHERFLAANSNFVIPKGEFTMFRIKNVNFKYGCHLVDVVDANEDTFLVLINSCYVLDNMVCDMVLKLYEPYKILFDVHYKLIFNVTKFECFNYSKQ